MSFTSDQKRLDQNFKELYFEYYAVAQRTAMYVLMQIDTSEDVAQSVFLKLWDKRDQLDQLNNPKAYIIQMARSGALDVVKKGGHLSKNQLQLGFYSEISDEPENVDRRQAIEKAMADLSPKCRLVFSLSQFEGQSNPEIAENLDVSIRAVETQISNVLKSFFNTFQIDSKITKVKT